jgi:hypothetical protein
MRCLRALRGAKDIVQISREPQAGETQLLGYERRHTIIIWSIERRAGIDIDDHKFRNPAELTKQLREKLPKRPKRKSRHHAALPYAETPQFTPELAGADSGAVQALRFPSFTVCRTKCLELGGPKLIGHAQSGRSLGSA